MRFDCFILPQIYPTNHSCSYRTRFISDASLFFTNFVLGTVFKSMLDYFHLHNYLDVMPSFVHGQVLLNRGWVVHAVVVW